MMEDVMTLKSMWKNQVHENLQATVPNTIKIKRKMWNISTTLLNYTGCTCEIKSRFAMAKTTFNKKKARYNTKLNLN